MLEAEKSFRIACVVGALVYADVVARVQWGAWLFGRWDLAIIATVVALYVFALRTIRIPALLPVVLICVGMLLVSCSTAPDRPPADIIFHCLDLIPPPKGGC